MVLFAMTLSDPGPKYPIPPNFYTLCCLSCLRNGWR